MNKKVVFGDLGAVATVVVAGIAIAKFLDDDEYELCCDCPETDIKD